MTVIFRLVQGTRFANRAFVNYIHIAVEAVAVLSWLAGFVAAAVSISTDSCSAGKLKKVSCGSIKAATVFGAFEWLLFMVTAAVTAMFVFNGSRRSRNSTTTTTGVGERVTDENKHGII